MSLRQVVALVLCFSGSALAAAPAHAQTPSNSPAPAAQPIIVSEFVPSSPACPTPSTPIEVTAVEDDYQRVWGVLGVRGFVFGDHVAPNGVDFMPFFTLDMDFNMWLWPSQGLYLFTDTHFWAQKPGPGITNGNQGYFDFSKRELDFTAGTAWNYYGYWEARVFAYSYNNLNRGDSASLPSGFNDGIGIENRLYINDEYERLGRTDYDVDRAAFVSFGYYPTKDMVDNDGHLFKPSLFAHAYLVYPLYEDMFYAYLDTELLTEKPVTPKMLCFDGGFALYPFQAVPGLQFRLGSQDSYDLLAHEWETSLYLAVRLRF